MAEEFATFMKEKQDGVAAAVERIQVEDRPPPEVIEIMVNPQDFFIANNILNEV